MAVVLTVLVVGGGALVGFAYVRNQQTTVHFCSLGLYGGGSGEVHMRTEDQGSPGRDGCESTPTNEPYLGFDCIVHYPDGWPGEHITTRAEPNRPDGSCGQPDRPE